MKYQRGETQHTIELSFVDLGVLFEGGIAGDRDGVFGPDSKIHLRKPQTREERKAITDYVAYVLLDGGQDITVVTHEQDIPVNGFVQHVPLDILMQRSPRPEVTEAAFPVGGLIVRSEAYYPEHAQAQLEVVDAVTNRTVCHNPGYWKNIPRDLS